MPQVDVQWPSEDEDFDATTDTNQSTKTATKDKPSAKKVDVNEPEPTTETETPVNETPAEPTPEQTPAETPAPEAPVDEQAAQPDPDPVVDQEAANLAAAVDNDPGAVSQIPVDSKRSKMPNFNFDKGMLRLIGEAVLVLAVVGLGLWSWNLYNDRKNLEKQVDSLNANPQSVVQKQTQQLITKVSSLMQLPTGETPTVAEVSDASQARQQSSFFANAQNGDRVLMYVKAGEAILYRPSTNKIILVAPLVFTNNGTTSSSTNKSATTPTASGTTSTKSSTTTTGR